MVDFDGTVYEKNGETRLLYSEKEKVQAEFDGWRVQTEESAAKQAEADAANAQQSAPDAPAANADQPVVSEAVESQPAEMPAPRRF